MLTSLLLACALAQLTRDAKGRFGTAHEVAELHARALAA